MKNYILIILSILFLSINSCASIRKQAPTYIEPQVCLSPGKTTELIFSHKLKKHIENTNCPGIKSVQNYNTLSVSTELKTLSCNFFIEFESNTLKKYSFKLQSATAKCPQMTKVRFLNTDSKYYFR